MTALETIDRLVMYYQQFHHTCVTWYITVMGFFVAGLIAAPAALGVSIIVAILVVGSLLGLAFFMCIFHYGARIDVLKGYLKLPENQIPKDWRELHTKEAFRIKGIGSYFFLTILVLMQVALWWLTLAPHT